ncbi:MAG: hypothetical protein K2O64_01000 [Lactobacillus sp.]|nr:hypothetical protein [Lactobacillus sp.]
METRTCSVSKGKQEESSARHNNRKTVMKGKSKEEKRKAVSTRTRTGKRVSRLLMPVS